MKMTLLEIVQDILSDMNSDEVSSVTDTLESMQVAQIVKSSYMEMMGNKNWPHLKKLTTFSSSGTTSRPTHMSVEDNIKEVVQVSYNKKKSTDTKEKWSEVEWKEPDDFLRYTNARNTDNSDTVEITDVSGVKFLIKNDVAPTYYTSFDDENVVFDSYDSSVDSTLQAAKTQVLAYVMPTFTISDTFTPDLPSEMFPALLAEAKSTCFARIKQMQDGKSEQQSRRSRTWAGFKSWQVGGGWNFPDYGRKSKK